PAAPFLPSSVRSAWDGILGAAHALLGQTVHAPSGGSSHATCLTASAFSKHAAVHVSRHAAVQLLHAPAGDICSPGWRPTSASATLERDPLEHVRDRLARVHGGLQRLEYVLPANHHHRVDAAREQ